MGDQLNALITSERECGCTISFRPLRRSVQYSTANTIKNTTFSYNANLVDKAPKSMGALLLLLTGGRLIDGHVLQNIINNVL